VAPHIRFPGGMSEQEIEQPSRKSRTRAPRSVDDAGDLGPCPIQLGMGAELWDVDEAKASDAPRFPRRGQYRVGVGYPGGTARARFRAAEIEAPRSALLLLTRHGSLVLGTRYTFPATTALSLATPGILKERADSLCAE
jgi:hypothetical protein